MYLRRTRDIFHRQAWSKRTDIFLYAVSLNSIIWDKEKLYPNPRERETLQKAGSHCFALATHEPHVYQCNATVTVGTGVPSFTTTLFTSYWWLMPLQYISLLAAEPCLSPLSFWFKVSHDWKIIPINWGRARSLELSHMPLCPGTYNRTIPAKLT